MSENASESIQTRRPDGTHRVVITGVGAVTPAGVASPVRTALSVENQ